MSDETETPEAEPEEILFYDGGIPMAPARWGRYSNITADINKYLAMKTEIEDKLAKGEPAYVQIMDERRRGSVGRIGKIVFDYRPPNQHGGYYNRHDHYLGINSLEVIWDGRKNKCSPDASEVEYLPTWTGGTEWQWHKGEAKEKVERTIPYDSLNQEIEPGQFVCFVHRRYGTISMKFGSVTRLTDRGGVFVKTLKLRDGERAGEELKAYNASDLLIVNDKLMGRLMMARLAAD